MSPAPAPPTSGASSEADVIGLSSGAAVALALGGGVVCYRRRKKKKGGTSINVFINMQKGGSNLRVSSLAEAISKAITPARASQRDGSLLGSQGKATPIVMSHQGSMVGYNDATGMSKI